LCFPYRHRKTSHAKASDTLENNYSQYTSKFQQHEWKFTPTIATVVERVNMYNEMSPKEAAKPLIVPILIVDVVAIIVAIVVVVYDKLRRK
jgi:hypothetical protein